MTKEINEQPLYLQVKEMILEKIKEDNLKPGDLLPTEPELEEMFKVSRTTVRNAINELKSEGYVIKQQGRGTFIADNSYEDCVALLQSFGENARKRGSDIKTVVFGTELIFPENSLMENLEIENEEPVLRIQRIRYIDGKLTNFTTSYLPRKIHEKLTWKEIDFRSTTLYSELRKAGVDLDNGEEIIELVSADEKLASLLKTDVGSPLIMNARKVYNRQGYLVEYSTTYTRGDRYRSYVKLKKNLNG